MKHQKKTIFAALALSVIVASTGCAQPNTQNGGSNSTDSVSSAPTSSTTESDSKNESNLSSVAESTASSVPQTAEPSVPSDLPEFYTDDPENEICMGDGTILKIADLEADPTTNDYILRGSIGAYEYEPYDNNSVRNPDDYDLEELKCLTPVRDSFFSGKKVTLKEGDSIGSKGFEVESCSMSIAPRVTYSKTLKKDIGIGYDVMGAEVKLKGTATFTGILFNDRFGTVSYEECGQSTVLFLPYSQEYHEAVPYLFDMDIQYAFLDCAMFYNFAWGDPKFAVSTSNPPITLGYLEDCDFLDDDIFTENKFWKEATITVSDLKYSSTERGGIGTLTCNVVSVDNITELE